MPKARQKVRPKEAIARAINSADWQPLHGKMKKQCNQCRYFFAVPAAEAEVTSRCPDCAGLGGRPRPAALPPTT
jgi:predicted Zn-ribbon and HTH transcriptional regulator